ncbi:MAG: DUF1684 domain-containing protein [Bacteroidales bacterium]|nr:DUF1684 domain-containing protein [Bacteroidales bacterium]
MKILTIVFIGIIIAIGSYKDKIIKYQNNLNKEFSNSETSPLTNEDIAVFKELDFYDIDESYNIEAELILNETPKEFGMKTTTKRRPTYIKYGTAKFELKGKSIEIAIYKNVELSKKEQYKDFLFMLFTDNTSGIKSYAGGRYIDLRIPKEGEKLQIDFNKAYNPYCAYNHKYSCPIPSGEDHISMEIEAGVMKWH